MENVGAVDGEVTVHPEEPFPSAEQTLSRSPSSRYPYMVARTVTIRRQSLQEQYGFTLRHMIVHPLETNGNGTESNAAKLRQSQDWRFLGEKVPSVEPVKLALVNDVLPKSLAAESGLRKGERILSINSRPVTGLNYPQVLRLIQNSGFELILMVVPSEALAMASQEVTLENSSSSAGTRSSYQSAATNLSNTSLNFLVGCVVPPSWPVPPSSPVLHVAGSTPRSASSDQMLKTVQQTNAVPNGVKPMHPPSYKQVMDERFAAQQSQITSSADNLHTTRKAPPSYHKSAGLDILNAPRLLPGQSSTSIASSSASYYSLSSAASQNSSDLVAVDNPANRMVNRPSIGVHRGLSADNVPRATAALWRPNQLPLPEIHENLIPDEPRETPKSAPPSAYRDSRASPCVVSAFPPLANPFKTGNACPKINKSASFEFESQKRSQDMLTKKSFPSESDRLSQLKLVDRVAKQFKDGQADLVGPLKLYHQQTHKRELERLVGQSTGNVLMKAACFESNATSPSRLSVSSSADFDSILLQGRDSGLQLNSPLPLRSDQHSPTISEPAGARRCESLRPPWVQARAQSNMPTRHQSFMAAVTGSDRPATSGKGLISARSLPGERNKGRYELETGQPGRRGSYVMATNNEDAMFDGQGVEKRLVMPTTANGDGESPHVQNGTCASLWLSTAFGHKQTKGEEGRRTSDRGWKNCWAVLNLPSRTLYISRDRPNVAGVIANDAMRIDVGGCIADIAYDYVNRRKHVFRLTTQQQSEHLFQAADGQEMLNWIQALQRCSSTHVEAATRNGTNGMSESSMALIIKRYEAQSQIVSPTNRSRRTGLLKLNKDKDAAVLGGLVSPRSESVEGPAVEASPKEPKARKWRRTKKSGSCPTSSERGFGADVPGPGLMFGQNLEDCPTSGEEDYVPLVVQLCAKVVEAHGLDTVGVYRIPGNSAAVNTLMASLNKGFENVDFNDTRWRDVNVVSSLMKAYFRKLPDPLLTNRLYNSFIEANRIELHQARLKRLRQLIDRLPRINYETLKYLVMHLRRVVAHSDVNRMETRNLALMFGPSLVRPSGDSMQTMCDLKDQCSIIEILLLYCDYLFLAPPGSPVPAVLPNDVSPQSCSASFSDMSDLLRRVSKTEDDLEKTKDNLVRSILQMRRGSRKPKGNSPPKRPSVVGIEDDAPTPVVENDDMAVSGSFSERNIDEEIALRKRKIDQDVATLNAAHTGTSGFPRDRRSGPADLGNRNELEIAAEEMRRRREENIYSARRIFILGSDAHAAVAPVPPATSQLPPPADSQQPGLNLTPRSMDVLTPETRERLRLFQSDPTSLQRFRSPSMTGSWSENSHSQATKALNLETVSVTSRTSDYSTTSSNADQLGCDGKLIPSTTSLVVPSSDYSSNASPTTPHLPKKVPVATSNSSSSVHSFVQEQQTSPLYDRTRLRKVMGSEGIEVVGTAPWVMATHGGDTALEKRQTVKGNRAMDTGRPWYEEDATGQALDQNRNVRVVSAPEKQMSSPALLAKNTPERTSRISQKIKFRTKTSVLTAGSTAQSSKRAADKRRDGRRHTLSNIADMEQIKSILFGGNGQDQDQPTPLETVSAREEIVKLTPARRERSTSRTDRIKSWFKESFRRSSPDLTAEVPDDPGPKTPMHNGHGVTNL